MLTSLSLAILAKERNFASTVIDLKQKSESAPPASPAQPTTESHPSGDTAPAGH
jgi:preprotein translocase subunit SecG